MRIIDHHVKKQHGNLCIFPFKFLKQPLYLSPLSTLVIQEDKISFNITSTKHRNATVTKEKFKLLMNDTEDLGTSKLI